jgi:cyclopropane-fatty-acyl-phospholipid synthase
MTSEQDRLTFGRVASSTPARGRPDGGKGGVRPDRHGKNSDNRAIVRAEAFFSKLWEQAGGQIPAFELRMPAGSRRFGVGEPAFTIGINSAAGHSAIASGDENVIAEAYMNRALELDGDMLALYGIRNVLRDRHPLLHFWWTRLQPRIFGQVARDKQAIAKHYDYEQDFYLIFLDRKLRCYSQGIFVSDDEELESAIERKLAFALESLRVPAGGRVLDIGGGWGAFAEYAGGRGLEVTSLTISAESHRFIQGMIDRQDLPCRVLLEHFYEHQSEPYDAIANLGVTEHLPDYRRSLECYYRLLKPGGRIYLDASACREKHDFSSFIHRYIYPGNPTPMCLAEYIAEVERSAFEIVELQNDRHSYELTSRHWASRLDGARDEIVRRWGEAHYRKFRLYLWGTVHAFATNLMGAYRLILERPKREENLGRWRYKSL